MSTHSNIVIKVRPEDYQRVSNKIKQTVNKDYPYIEIYSHADGYPKHMLPELKCHFNNYDAALELVLEGSTSGVYDGVSKAYTKRGDSYEDNAPWICSCPSCNEEFLYVFKYKTWTAVKDN